MAGGIFGSVGTAAGIYLAEFSIFIGRVSGMGRWFCVAGNGADEPGARIHSLGTPMVEPVVGRVVFAHRCGHVAAAGGLHEFSDTRDRHCAADGWRAALFGGSGYASHAG